MPPHEQEVPPSTAMFSRVKANVALPVGYHVDRITRLTNPELRAGYKAYLEYLAGQGCAGEAVLYHAVEWGAVEAVKRSGFSRSHRGINADVLGRGVYFTVNAAVAARFAHPGPNGERALFVARVALGRQMVGGNGGAAPGVRGDGQYCHSTVDNLGLPSLYATFYTSQCIPVFVIYFRVLVHVRAALPPAAATSAATGQLQTRPFGGRAAPAASAPQPRAAPADAATGQTQTRGHIDGSPRPATDEELRRVRARTAPAVGGPPAGPAGAAGGAVVPAALCTARARSRMDGMPQPITLEELRCAREQAMYVADLVKNGREAMRSDAAERQARYEGLKELYFAQERAALADLFLAPSAPPVLWTTVLRPDDAPGDAAAPAVEPAERRLDDLELRILGDYVADGDDLDFPLWDTPDARA